MQIRDYRAADEDSWLRCRVLSFMYTNYYMDVKTAKTSGVEFSLVAVEGDEVVGILDVECEKDAATIDTIAVHPDHGRKGIATALLDTAVGRLAGYATIDAWTRQDQAANAWYQRNGFTEATRYLHVHADYDQMAKAAVGVDGMRPVKAFLHASIDREAEIRASFEEVYICRQYIRDLKRD